MPLRLLLRMLFSAPFAMMSFFRLRFSFFRYALSRFDVFLRFIFISLRRVFAGYYAMLSADAPAISRRHFLR